MNSGGACSSYDLLCILKVSGQSSSLGSRGLAHFRKGNAEATGGEGLSVYAASKQCHKRLRFLWLRSDALGYPIQQKLGVASALVTVLAASTNNSYT